MLAIFFNGPWEWIIILVVVLLLFGHRIPGMARSLGTGIVEFKKGLKTGEKDDDDPQLPSSGTTGTKAGSREKQEAGT